MVVTDAELRFFSLVLLLLAMIVLLVVARVSELRWGGSILTQYIGIAARDASKAGHCVCLLAGPNIVGLV